MTDLSTPSVAYSHAGATVPDLDAAVAWYTESLGLYLLAGPIEMVEDDSPLGRAAANIYGAGFGSIRFAHLAFADGAGLELFQFAATPADGRAEFAPTRPGIYHVALTAPDLEATAARIVAAGGAQTSDVIVVNPEKNFRIVYCSDPWGTAIELCSNPYLQMWN
ncbi:VOC family protein [Micrococcales bacterium 31B]|nr:VOC family protein [Micrococcales bacterium 31B]